MKNKMLVKVLSVAMLVTMLFSFSGCETKKAIEFVNQTTEVMNAIQTENSNLQTEVLNFNTALGTDPASVDVSSIISVIEKLEEQYKKLGEIETPKVASDVKPMFEEASSKALEAFAIYKKEFSAFDPSILDDDTAAVTFVERLLEGDALLEESSKKLTEAGNKLTEIAK